MSDRAAEALMLGLLLVLPASALFARRLPLRRTLFMVAAWIGIFIVGLVVAGQRDRFGMLQERRQIEGRETRITMAADGHFWADVGIGGVRRRMLIDSGATTTVLSAATAKAAGLNVDSPFPVMLDTANGRITAQTAKVGLMRIGDLAARDVHVVVAPMPSNTEVIGMNVLSQLAAWRVESRTLVLIPAKPASWVLHNVHYRACS